MGSAASGIIDVAGMGIGSVIHHVAQRMVMAAVQQTSSASPKPASVKYMMAASAGPSAIKMAVRRFDSVIVRVKRLELRQYTLSAIFVARSSWRVIREGYT